MFCPWDSYAPATIEFCERLLNGWVRQPANTWSNIGFVLVGMHIWRKTHYTKHWLRLFAVGSFLVGLTSIAFHMTMTFFAQFFDVASMFMTAGILVVLNAMRLRWITQKYLYWTYAFLQINAMLLMYVFQGTLGEKIFAAEVFFIAFSELALFLKYRPSFHSYRWFIAGAASIATAAIIWLLDIKKIWCDPDNHWFNGHAAWHILCALTVLFLSKFYDEAVTMELSPSEAN